MPTREGNYFRNVFSSWKRRNNPRFRTLLFGKEAATRFFYKCSNSGIYESTPINSGNEVVDKQSFSRNFSPKKSSPENIARFLPQKSVLRPALRSKPGVVIPLNPEGMGIGEWVILFSEGMGMGMGMGMGNSSKNFARERNFFFGIASESER